MKKILILFISTFLYANGPTKQEVHKMLLNRLPKSLCKNHTIAKKCYKVTIDECKRAVSKLVTPCFKKYEDRFDKNINREKFIDITEDIGECVGYKYGIIFRKKLKFNIDCFNSIKKISLE